MIKNFKTADFLLIKAEFLSLDENETVFFMANGTQKRTVSGVRAWKMHSTNWRKKIKRNYGNDK